ncbi:Holliday junction DNA helicase RuvB [Spiroplasma corruscae]|uniref:Holliday junction branch migration complex subunit RuvB n=1 Tax=Spiroplasma corruscae TaxID=216934 RepID=A0A222EP28_9MOLU|nr:Holliday junction branch migration DNA helicase RuvB [Spiroplasma corruscae]ASP28276.1 Holliday junction DNA helicase RuvB [Spiroplasma corruscae]
MKIINNLRPKSFDEYIGQKNVVENLKIFIESAKKRCVSLDHIILNGNSGLGKTSLAYLIASTMNKKIFVLNGTSLQKPSDIISPLTSIKEGEFLFIDEVHACSKEVFEVLYPVLEDNRINVIIGKEYNSKIINVKINSFTLIVATTEINKLALPFINRFPINLNFKEYNANEIEKILNINANKMQMQLTDSNYKLLATYCKNNPRVAINLLKRIYDYLTMNNDQKINNDKLLEILKKLEIYKYGISQQEIDYLIILQRYNTLGLENISHLLSISQQLIITSIEPILYKNNLINKTPKGRIITQKGIEYLKNYNKT